MVINVSGYVVAKFISSSLAGQTVFFFSQSRGKNRVYTKFCVALSAIRHGMLI